MAERIRYDRRKAELFAGISQEPADILRILYGPDDVFEVKAHHCPDSIGGKYLSEAAGYFKDQKAAVTQIQRLEKFAPPGIFCTLNPVLPDLLGRAANKVAFKVKNTASNQQITCRRWLAIDIDPERAADVSATEIEMQSALDLAETVRTSLAKEGWPRPILGMSGNGAYLIYRVDLPNNAESETLLQRCVQSIASRFNFSGEAHVDTASHVANKGCPVFGTTKRKGDNLVGIAGVSDRPHRKSWFERPSGITAVVPIDLLKAEAAKAPEPPARQSAIIPTTAQPAKGRRSKGPQVTPLERCVRMLGKMKPAISGAGGHSATLAAAKACWGFLTTEGEVRTAMLWWNDNMCGGEPWGEKDLEHKINEGLKLIQKDKGVGYRLIQNAPPGKHRQKTARPETAPISAPAQIVVDQPPGKADEVLTISLVPSPEADENRTEREVIGAIKIDVLGCMKKGVKVFSMYHRRTSIIDRPAKLAYEDILTIAGPPVQSFVELEAQGDIPEGMYTMQQVREAIALLAGYKSLSDESELGVGCWPGATQTGEEYPSVVMVGRGEAAEWNGDARLRHIDHPRCRGHVLDFESAGVDWYEYKALAALCEQAKDPAWRERVLLDVLALFQKWRWKNEKSSPLVVTALSFATWIQTFWAWRPMVSIIGQSNSGKSTLVHCLAAMFGKLAKTSSDSSAAGMRQILQSSARIIIHDEFDVSSGDKGRKMEHEKILKMLRAASRGDTIVRGTSDQKGQEFTLRHIVWLAGIHMASNQEADRNRSICLELLGKLPDAQKLVLPSLAELSVLGQRMLAVAVVCANEAKRLATSICRGRIEGVHDRIVESYAVPAGMVAAIYGLGEAGAIEYLKEMLADLGQSEREVVPDVDSLLGDIFSTQVQVGTERPTVSQLIDRIVFQGDSKPDNKALEAHGMKVAQFSASKHIPKDCHGVYCLAVNYNTVSSKLLRGTRWADQGIDQILRRYPGAHNDQKKIGHVTRCIALPLESVSKQFLGRSLLDRGNELPD